MSANGINLNTLKHKGSIDGTERLVVFSKTKSVPSREISIDELIDQALVNINDGENTTVTTAEDGQVSIDLDYTKGTVTQGTSATTAVTVNAAAGVIRSFAVTTAAGSSFTFTVNNSKVATDSVILLNTSNAGTGLAHATLTAAPSAGSFSVKISNIHASAAFNSVINLHFAVL